MSTVLSLTDDRVLGSSLMTLHAEVICKSCDANRVLLLLLLGNHGLLSLLLRLLQLSLSILSLMVEALLFEFAFLVFILINGTEVDHRQFISVGQLGQVLVLLACLALFELSHSLHSLGFFFHVRRAFILIRHHVLDLPVFEPNLLHRFFSHVFSLIFSNLLVLVLANLWLIPVNVTRLFSRALNDILITSITGSVFVRAATGRALLAIEGVLFLVIHAVHRLER